MRTTARVAPGVTLGAAFRESVALGTTNLHRQSPDRTGHAPLPSHHGHPRRGVGQGALSPSTLGLSKPTVLRNASPPKKPAPEKPTRSLAVIRSGSLRTLRRPTPRGESRNPSLTKAPLGGSRRSTAPAPRAPQWGGGTGRTARGEAAKMAGGGRQTPARAGGKTPRRKRPGDFS